MTKLTPLSSDGPGPLRISRIDRLVKAEKPPMLIEGVLGRRAVHVWSGMPYSGKTFLAIEAMRAIVYGEPFLGHFRVPRAGNVLYLGNDSPDWDVAQQFEKVVGLPDARDLDSAIHEGPMGGFGFVFDSSFALSTAADAQRLVDAARAFSSIREYDPGSDSYEPVRGTSLIVIDTLRSVHGFEENDNTEMQHVINLLRYIADQTGTAVLALHHFNKSHPGERGHVSLERLRGAVAIAGGVDSVLALMPKEGTVAVRILKHRVDPKQPEFMYETVDSGPGRVVLSLSSNVGVVNPGILGVVVGALTAVDGWVSTSTLNDLALAAIPDAKKAANAVSHALRKMEKAGEVERMHGAARLKKAPA
jgi:hypothetical protein